MPSTILLRHFEHFTEGVIVAEHMASVRSRLCSGLLRATGSLDHFANLVRVTLDIIFSACLLASVTQGIARSFWISDDLLASSSF
jgi:hypothetical protein